MLYRVSGKLNDGRPFASRIEASNAIHASGIGRAALNEAGIEDKDVHEIRARGVKGGKSVRIGTAPDPNAPKKVRAAKPAATTNAPTNAPTNASKAPAKK